MAWEGEADLRGVHAQEADPDVDVQLCLDSVTVVDLLVSPDRSCSMALAM
jgi:hypothetical protein